MWLSPHRQQRGDDLQDLVLWPKRKQFFNCRRRLWRESILKIKGHALISLGRMCLANVTIIDSVCLRKPCSVWLQRKTSVTPKLLNMSRTSSACSDISTRRTMPLVRDKCGGIKARTGDVPSVGHCNKWRATCRFGSCRGCPCHSDTLPVFHGRPRLYVSARWRDTWVSVGKVEFLSTVGWFDLI